MGVLGLRSTLRMFGQILVSEVEEVCETLQKKDDERFNIRGRTVYIVLAPDCSYRIHRVCMYPEDASLDVQKLKDQGYSLAKWTRWKIQ